jgi:tetraacyldisaccharide 4'-kinase
MKTPFWFSGFNPLALILLPVSLVYYTFAKLIWIYRLFCRFSSKTPVICVGGILAGGVGKTPIVREIARRFNAPVVMRGYRGKNKKSGMPVKYADLAVDVGDEAKMLVESGATVYVGNRRQNTEAINYSANVSEIDAIVMDDGFQNPGVKKDVSLVVFDESVGIGNGLLLPAGPLRETVRSGIGRCDAVLIVQGGDGLVNTLSVIRTAKRLKKPVFFARKEMNAKGFFGKYVAFAGIGYPSKFFDDIRAVPSIRIVEKIPFPDHHYYNKNDIVRLFRAAKKYEARLVCTEKDWVKLPRNIKAKVRYVPLQITIQPNFYAWLEKKLAEKKEERNVGKNENC